MAGVGFIGADAGILCGFCSYLNKKFERKKEKCLLIRVTSAS